MQIQDDKKIDILLSALEERYSAIHKIRDRVQGIGVWILGLLIVAGGWLVQSDTQLNGLQQVFGIVGIISGFLALRFSYLKDLEKGFRTQLQASAQIEEILGLFEPGFFDSHDKSVFQQSWRGSGTKNGSGKFFRSTYLLLYIGTAFIIVAILFSGFDTDCGFLAELESRTTASSGD